MRRALSLFLSVVLICSCFFSIPVSADQISYGHGWSVGGGIKTGGGTTPPGGWKFKDGLQVTTYGWSWRGDTAVRIRAFPITNKTNEEYFNKDGTVLHQLSYGELVSKDSYNTTSGWHYFCNATYKPDGTSYQKWTGQSFMHVFDDNVAEMVSMAKCTMDSPDYAAFIKACSPTSADLKRNSTKLLTVASELSDVLNTDLSGSPEKRIELGTFLGLSAAEASKPYYIVAEQIVYCHVAYMNNNSVWWFVNSPADKVPFFDYGSVHFSFTSGEFCVGESRAVWEAKDPGKNGTRMCDFMFDGNTSFLGTTFYGGDNAKNYTSKIEKAHWVQDKPWFPDHSLGTITDGYTIYSFDEGSNAVGGNVAVEYDGDVNTSDPGKFKSTGSLIGSGETSLKAYWDFDSRKWVDSEDTATLLQFAGKIDTTNEYALCFTSTAGHSISGTDLELVPGYKSAFEDAPGQGYTSGSLVWGSPKVTGAPVNIGYTWKVVLLDGYQNTQSIVNKFQEAFNAVNSSGSLSMVVSNDTTETYKNEAVLDGSWNNAQEGILESSTDVLNGVVNGNPAFKEDEILGMGYEFIVRGTPVTSRKITIKADAIQDNAGNILDVSVSDSETWCEDYTTVRSTTCSVHGDSDYNFVVWFVVPGQDDSLTPGIKTALEGVREANNGAFRTAALSAISSSLIQGQGTNETVIGLGSTSDEPPIGYTVYEIMWNGEPQPVVGQVVLPAYMLNRYFNNVIQTSSMLAGTPEKFTLAKDWCWVEWTNYVYCDADGSLIGPDAYKDDWVIEYYDSASSQEFGLDNAMLDRYYPKGTGNWSSSVRSKLTKPWAESMDTRYMPENTHVVDYAFNLVRGNQGFGDKRSISGISYKTYVAATGDSDDLLKITAQFGVTPSVVKKSAPARSSTAPVATYFETFNIQSRFQHTASPTGQKPKPMVAHSHKWFCGGCRGNSEDGYWCPGHLCFHMYYPGLNTVTCMGFYGQVMGRVNTINYKFSNTAYKYTTKDDLGAGKNDFLGSSASKPLTTARRNSTAGSITPSNFYRFTTVRYNNIDLKFHPENLMVFKIGGTDFAQINGQPYTMGYTMSEVKRTSKSSGMYFFRLNADITSVPGTVYSDSMQGGTGILGMGSTVSIPAGADVTVAADPSGVAVDLYGYVLDLVQTDDDGKIGAVGSGRAYDTVVRSGKNAYNEWGNTTSHADMLRHFNEWCDNMLKVENYAADFQLFVGSGSTSLKSENFSATVGRVERGSAGTVEEGIYQLVVEKGILQTGKGDYNALISQIATDYGCSNSEAKAMFEESAIYTAIINGMETCKNPKNNSKDVLQGLNYTPDIKAEWTNQLGGDGNWYDETSRTFVIRRFTNLGNTLHDVIATDKIDYQLAPTGSGTAGENINSGLSYNAWWHMSIFFDQNRASQVNDLLLGSSKYYDPQNGSAGFNPANNAYSVMFNSIPVANADFKIPASSTQDFYN